MPPSMASEAEIARLIAAMRRMREEVKGNPALAREHLLRAGIITESGELAPPYREEPQEVPSVF